MVTVGSRDYVVTARIRRTTEGNVFTLATISEGGGTPSQIWVGGGTPSQVWMGGGVPHPRSGQGGSPSQV